MSVARSKEPDESVLSISKPLNETTKNMDPPRMPSLQDVLYSPSDNQACASSRGSSEALYTPQVKDELIPKVDKVFASLEEAHRFYNDYAREAGFGVRINSSKLGKGGLTVRKEFVCHKEGVRAKKYTQNVSENTIRKRGLTRENCGAKMTVVKRGEGFVVTQFVGTHNHTLATPKKVHLLRSHRKMSAAQRALTDQLGNANVPTHQQMSILEMQAGGLQNVGCSQQDLYNAQRDKRKMVDGFDASLLVEYFEAQQEKNPSFIFSILPDDEGSLYHCFWADATMRKSYQYFGDVVVFDTTYQTNKYSLIFSPIIGVNHHGQTTMFGCAFLSGEKTDAFEWLFNAWLEAMPAGAPKMIITDQDPAMAKAISTRLPNTVHRYCIWHIVCKFSEKISAIYYKDHYDEFRNCIWNSETPEDFERRWGEIVAKANLSNNEWLDGLYQIRERWVPAYTRHIFSAHMTSSQRAEGCHAFFKRYVCPQNSLLDFVTRFARALSHLRHNELDSDHKDVNEKPLLVTKTLMESTMREVYTRSVFYKFQQELLDSGAYVVKSTFKDEMWVKYNVPRSSLPDSKGRELVLDKSSNFVKCSCKKFESDGIPCRHILAYFTKKQIKVVPEQYILRRWTKAAKASRVMDDGTVSEICDTPMLMKRNRLFRLASKVIDACLLSDDEAEGLEEYLVSTEARLASKMSDLNIREESSVRKPLSLGKQPILKDPRPVRSKGCGKRLKGGKEKAMKKKRRCNGCGKLATHDKRNCPVLLGISSGDGRLNNEDDEDDEDDEDVEQDDMDLNDESQ